MIDIKNIFKMLVMVCIIFFSFIFQVTISATSSYEYIVYFDYQLIRHYYGESTLISSGKNICDTKIEDATGALNDLSISIFSDKSIHNNILKLDSYISFTDFTIQVNTNYQEVDIELFDEFNNSILKSNNNILKVSDLIDQGYYCKVICADTSIDENTYYMINNNLELSFSFVVDTEIPSGIVYDSDNTIVDTRYTNSKYISFDATDDSGISEIFVIYNDEPIKQYIEGTRFYDNGTYKFYSIDNAGNRSNTVYVYMDHTIPILSINNAQFFSSSNNSFTIETEDESTVYLYCKNPEKDNYEIITSKNITIDNSMPKGKYYFYAEDILGNKTDEVWVEYNGDNLVSIITIDQSNSIYLTWESNDIIVMVNDIEYTKNTVISEEGIYNVDIIDSTNNIFNMVFEIKCYYILEEQKQATCLEEGFSIYKCITCENVEVRDLQKPLNHEYIGTYLHSTCTTKGGLQYSCKKCDNSYIIHTVPPTGHEYIYEIINVNCVSDGVRIITCKNCDYLKTEEIKARGHNFVLFDYVEGTNEYTYAYVCKDCAVIEEVVNEKKHGLVLNFVNELKNNYFSYLVWILLVSVGICSVSIGTRYIFLKQNEEVAITKCIIKNYIFGIIAIFIIIAILPFLLEGLIYII